MRRLPGRNHSCTAPLFLKPVMPIAASTTIDTTAPRCSGVQAAEPFEVERRARRQPKVQRRGQQDRQLVELVPAVAFRRQNDERRDPGKPHIDEEPAPRPPAHERAEENEHRPDRRVVQAPEAIGERAVVLPDRGAALRCSTTSRASAFRRPPSPRGCILPPGGRSRHRDRSDGRRAQRGRTRSRSAGTRISVRRRAVDRGRPAILATATTTTRAAQR